MTLTLALRTALSGLSATQTALQTTSQNITNVNTEGYSRKDVTFTTRTVNGTGAGVNIANVDRVVDEFLIKKYAINRRLSAISKFVKNSWPD